MALPYATQADLDSYVWGGSGLSASDANLLLDRASFDLDQILFPQMGPVPQGVQSPSVPPIPSVGAAGSLTGTFLYRVTFVVGEPVFNVSLAGETEAGVASAPVTVSGQQVSLTAIPTGPTAAVTARHVYRTPANGALGSEKLALAIADNTTTAATDNIADGSLGVVAPSQNTTSGRNIDLASLTARQQQALNRACCAQAEYRLEMGEKFYVRAQYKSTGGPDFSTQGRLPVIAPKALRELTATGLFRTGARASHGQSRDVMGGFIGQGGIPVLYPYPGGGGIVP